MLGVIDEKWKDHLYDLDQLREGIYYRSWGQKDPLVEYKTEAFEMFKGLMSDVENTFAEGWFKDWWRNMPIEIAVPGGAPGAPAALRPPARTLTGPAGGQPGGGRRPAPVVATKPAADGLITSSEPAPMRVPRPATPEPAFARQLLTDLELVATAVQDDRLRDGVDHLKVNVKLRARGAG